jgi:branched-chain amino acid transport system substrate-binding protein
MWNSNACATARVVILAGVVALTSWSSPGLAADNETFRIGVIGPLTGATARFGTFAWRGAGLAAEEINAAGGVLGKKIELIQGDSRCVPAEGASAARRMIDNDKVGVIVGDICSSVTLAMQPIAETAQVVLMNAASSNPDITYKAGVGGFKWTFRNYPTDEIRAQVVLKQAKKDKNYRKYAALSVDSDYGRGAITFSKKYLASVEAELVSEDYFKDSETDFRPVLSKIKSSGAQAILMYGLPDTTITIVRQMREMGLQNIKLVGAAEFTSPKIIRAAPQVMDGTIEAQAWLPDWTSPESEKFVANYKKKYDELPQTHAYTHWETIHMLAAAAKAANSTDPKAIRDALTSIKYESAMGVIRFDDHNQAEAPLILLEIKDGTPVIKGIVTGKIQYTK